MKHFLSRLCILIFVSSFLIAVKPAYAMEFRSSEKDVRIQENEMIDGSLFAAGNTVQIDGAVEGDLYCAGQSIVVKGPVGGDVLCAGQTIQIDGPVEGSIRVAAQTISIQGSVIRNINAFGQTVSVGKESMIDGDAILGGQSVTFLGDIGKSILAGGDSVLIDGTVGGDATLGGNSIKVGPAAFITGKFSYESDKEAVIADGTIGGETVRKPMRKEFKEMNKPKKQFPRLMGFMNSKPWPMNAFGSLLTHMVIGALVILFFRKGSIKVLEVMKDHTALSFGIGLLWLLVFIPVFILLIITIIGIPVAAIYAFIFALSIMAGKLFTALYIGKEILAAISKNQKEQLYGALLIGVTLVWLVFYMPFIGGLTSLIAILWGTGGLVKACFVKNGKKAGK